MAVEDSGAGRATGGRSHRATRPAALLPRSDRRRPGSTLSHARRARSPSWPSRACSCWRWPASNPTKRPSRDWLKSRLPIVDPEEPKFRIGSIGVAVHQSEFLSITLSSTDDEESATFVVTPEQFRAMALVAVEVVAAGRPICPRCGLPEDPDGHRCPSVNGHHG